MWLARFLFGKKRESAALIDVSADSVAGAYVRFVEGRHPAIVFARRVPVEAKHGEARERALARALSVLSDALMREGAAVLKRATGSALPGDVLIALGAPWQETAVRTERLEPGEPFTFTRHLMLEAVEKVAASSDGRTCLSRDVVGVRLNGYPTAHPYGKKTKRAVITVLASFADARMASLIRTFFERRYPSRPITLVAGSVVRYQAVLAAFPHERNLLIFDPSSCSTAIALVRDGFLVAAAEMPEVAKNERAWAKGARETLAQLATLYPLPRVLFFLARTNATGLLQALDAADLGPLWLSEHTPKIVPLTPSHLPVKNLSLFAPDLSIALMAVYRDRHGVFFEKL